MSQYHWQNGENNYNRDRLCARLLLASAAQHDRIESDQIVPEVNLCHHEVTDSYVVPSGDHQNNTSTSIRLFGTNVTVYQRSDENIVTPRNINDGVVNNSHTQYPIENAPPRIVVQALPASNLITNMRTGNVFSASFPSVGRREIPMSPFYNAGNNNFIPIDSQNGTGNGNMNQYNYFESFQDANLNHYRSFNDNIQLPNAPAMINYQQYEMVSPTTGAVTSRFVAPTLVPAVHDSYHDSIGTSQQDHVSQHQTPRFTRTPSIERVVTSTSSELRMERIMLRDQISNILELVRRGLLDMEGSSILEYTLALSMLISQDHLDRTNDLEEWPDEMNWDPEEEEQIELETGLSEEQILTNINIENFQSSEESEMCTICQADCEDGERIGIIDCGHIFHLDCVKQWLMLKNICPLCKQTALNVEV